MTFDVSSSCCRMDHEETRCRLVVDERSATSLPPRRRRSSLATRSRYVLFQTRNERQVLCAAEDTGLTGAIIGGGPVRAAAGPAMRRWARRGCCYLSTPDQRWVSYSSISQRASSLFWPILLFPPEIGLVFFFVSYIFSHTRIFHRNENISNKNLVMIKILSWKRHFFSF